MAEAIINPQELKYRFILNKQLPSSITITNPGQERLAFKVKTTMPKRYVVRPSSAIIEPGANTSVQVIMQAQKEYSPELVENCKDKFLIQTVFLKTEETITQDTFNKELNQNLQERRLRVVIEGPAAPPSPVPEASENEEDGARADQASGVKPLAVDGSAIKRGEDANLKMKVEKLANEKAELQRKLNDTLGAQSSSQARRSQSNMPTFFLIQILLVAVVAFMIGHFTA